MLCSKNAKADRNGSMANQAELPIHDMADRHPGLTEALADALTEAAAVCLGRHHHSPTEFDVESGDIHTAAVVRWQRVNERVRRAWRNEIDATEWGACACALAAVELLDGLVAVGRAETKTGADYYIAPVAGSGPPVDIHHFDDCLRLEVSGVDRGSEGAVNKRLGEKLMQAAVGDSDLPAMACVVGFKAKLVKLAALEAGGTGN